jgi:uncharacterized protein
MSQPFTLYDVTVPALKKGLTNLAAILKKAETYAADKNIKTEVILGARLALDMLPLARQIQIVSDNAKGAVGRLAAVDMPKYEDDETTFEALQQRLAKTLAFIDTIDPKAFEGAEGREIVLTFGQNSHHFTGLSYVHSYLMPNFFFHVSMAYAILRHYGVTLGKSDYIA